MQDTRTSEAVNTFVNDFKVKDSIISMEKNYQLNKLIDSTLLSPNASENDIKLLCLDAVKYDFKSVCIPPSYVPYANKILFKTPVLVCTVISFPFGYCLSEIKVDETKKAIDNGANEIDFVQNITLIKNKKYDELYNEFLKIRNICKDAILKVIVETSLLSEEEIIFSSKLACEAGIDILKTSTGYGNRGASQSDITLFSKVIQDYQLKNKRMVGIKASGGIKTKADALNFVKLGATRIGTSSGKNILLDLNLNLQTNY